MARNHPRFNLILDFDGTITTEDTTAIIGSKCLAKARELAPPNVDEDQLPKSMQYYSDKYMKEYQQWKASLKSQAQSRTLNDEVLRLSQSKHVEQGSFLRVKNAVLSVPGGIKDLLRSEAALNEFMTDAGRQAIRSGELQIRDRESLQRLISKVERDGNTWGVVSVSWSRGFILGVLLESGLVSTITASLIKRVKCNELLAPEHADKDGNHNVVCSAQDKVEALQQLLDEGSSPAREDSSGSREKESALNVYVGDSSTDLGCLINADVGMYMCPKGLEQDSVLQMVERFRVKRWHTTDLPTLNVPIELLNMKTRLLEDGRPPHIICSVSGFREIDQWLSRALSYSG